METNPPTTPPNTEMFRLITAFWTSQAIGAAARLGLADVLAAGPRPSDDIARAVGANPDALYRLLRMLAMVGVFEQTSPRTFGLTPLGQTLRSDSPGSLRAMAITQTSAAHWLGWGKLHDAVRTGQSVAKAALGMEIYEYFGKNPEDAAAFNDAMSRLSDLEAKEVVRVYDFSGARTLADIGGGHGTLLSAVLASRPSARGILFDLPPVVATAPQALERRNIADRCAVIGGDFFESVPDGADVHLLKHVLHNWNDREASRILRNCRRALDPGGKLVIVEFVVPADNRPSAAQPMDLNMLVLCGGRERTEEEFRRLLDDSGFCLERVVATHAPVSVIEASQRE